MFVCTLVSQVASFSGWECVECSHTTAVDSITCPKCDRDNHEIAGAVSLDGLFYLHF